MQQELPYSFWQLIRDLAHYIKPYKKTFWWGVFFRVTSDIANLYPAWAVSQIILLLTHKEPETFTMIILVLLVWAAVTVYFSFAHSYARYLGFQVAEQAGLDLYKKCLKHILNLDLAWQEKENSGNKMKRLDKGYEGMNQLIRRVFDVLIEVIVNTIGIVIIFATLKPAISYALIFFIVTYFFLGTYLLKKASLQEKIVNRKAEDLGGLTFESLNNIQTIKALAINQGITQTIQKHLLILIKEIKKRIFYFQSRDGILNLYEGVFGLTTISILIWSIVQNQTELSLLVLFLGLFQKVAESTRELSSVTQDFILAKIWISRAMHILQTKPIIENAEKQEHTYPGDWKELKIQHVHFAYEKGNALKDLTITIKRGEKIGIVGLSGAGKSTLFKLLLDLYENYEGEIMLDTTSFKQMNRQSYIDHVSVVLQDTELFNLSLQENITLAATKTILNPQQKFAEVITMAHLTDVVTQLPQKKDTIVGEKGIKLSGGQRQRVGIARALYRQPDILLLDEATSHLDAYSEKQIQQALHENMHKFTTIVIAHRLSTIKEMDKIVVLQDGHVEEYGTFQELIKKNGIFAKMWREQKL